MGNNLKFNSSVCTSIEQSKLLLEMGLKPETADMVYEYEGTYPYDCHLSILEDGDYISSNIITEDIPAWSLHRLMELLPQDIHLDDYVDTHYYLTINPFKVIYVNSHRSWIYQRDEGCLYDKLIGMIEWTIRNNFFNKEYLKQ